MHESSLSIAIDMRIPGTWSGPRELLERFPREYRLSPDALELPDGTRVDFSAMPADDQFARIFFSSCRQQPTQDEQRIVSGYKVNVLLSGPGGSLGAARSMMQAAAAFITAGGGGVFIDNGGIAHGGSLWLEMLDDGGPDALGYAFCSIVSSETQIWTMGLHALGLRDIIMQRDDAERGGFDIREVIRYSCRSETPIENGHLIADLDGPQFQAFIEEGDPKLIGSPMQNPFGRLKLVSLKGLGERN